MDVLKNPYRGGELPHGLDGIPWPSTDAQTPQNLFVRPLGGKPTPLHRAQNLAQECGVGTLLIKDERGRMGLGSFKALGAAYVIAHDAAQGDISARTYVTASAGNHGLSVAAGAAAFGAQSVVYIAETVPEAFAERLRAKKAEVIREGATYEDSMAAAARAAARNDWALLSDSSWPGYTERPHRLMEGYTVLMAELFEQIDAPPTHFFLQAGVGGLAAAAAAMAREQWGGDVCIVVVEPSAAPALKGSIAAGSPQESPGPVSIMGRLDCKEPSLIALKGLARDADYFAAISEEEGASGDALAARHGLKTTPSGAAGLSGVIAAAEQGDLSLAATSRALIVLSEGPEG